MSWETSNGELFTDLTIRPIASDASSDRCPRRPPWERAHGDDPPADDEEFDAAVLFSDSVKIGTARLLREAADRLTRDGAPTPTSKQETPSKKSSAACRIGALVPLNSVAVDLSTQWAALVEASALRPALRLWRPRRCPSSRPLRRAAGAPLGVPITPCETLLSRLGCQFAS